MELAVRIDSFEILSHFFSVINGDWCFPGAYGGFIYFFFDGQKHGQSRSLISIVPPWFLICTNFELFDIDVEDRVCIKWLAPYALPQSLSKNGA